MSKKKFKAGLESLFGDPAVAGMTPFLVEKEKPKIKTVKKIRKRSSSKNFTSDLETLFSTAVDNEIQEQKKQQQIKGKVTTIKKRSDRPVIGIDALIRRTIEDKKEGLTDVVSLKKRLTITLEKQKLEKLKKIAKEKKTYLRTIMDELVSEYLSKTN